MADGFICGQRGGGSGKSEIIVTAPTGSAVTATCGATVKTAAEKAGEWIFRNCDLGTWIIKVAKGGYSKEGAIVIKSNSQMMRYYIIFTDYNATIEVNYPEGAVCTCSNGDSILMAPDTGANYTFCIPYAGDWVIQITKDGKSKTIKQTVDREIVYTVNISFSLTLYDHGDQCLDNSGGYQIISQTAGSRLTFNSDCMEFYSEKNQGGGEPRNYASIFSTKELIDLSGYTTAKFSAKIARDDKVDYPNQYSGKCLVLNSSKSIVAEALIEPAGQILTVYVDLESLSGDFYIGFRCAGGYGYGNTLTVYSIVLE